ncbi:MAG TPA: UPF0149 family protein [Xanthobacteraceae bacterium]|jgi:uncharacterized protein|nr:UPF0149 family protein [Xanthobacteraceae bacterium]
MTLDEIILALKSPDAPPAAALTAGVAMADELAPLVYAIADKFSDGIYLLPGENATLLYGLYILAAAKHPELFDSVMAMIEQPESELDQLFPNRIATCLTQLLLSVWNDDTDVLFQAIEHANLIPDAKWALFDVLARLTFDGRIPRARTIAFLERLEREDFIEDGDSIWWGWEEAVIKLGITQLEPGLRRAWSKVINEQLTEEERAARLARMNRAAADPADRSQFEADLVWSVEDPVEALAWVEKQAKVREEWMAERETELGLADEEDPADAIRLTHIEENWLEGFLISSHVPETTMTFEELDGMVTALAIGPVTVLPSQYLPEVWGADGETGPEWDSTEQAEYFMSLLTKHWNAIAARRDADAPHDPFICEFDEVDLGQCWAEGFMAGVALGEGNWDRLFDDERAIEISMSIVALAGEDHEMFVEGITPEMRTAIVERLPVILQVVAAYWRDPDWQPPRSEPVRSTKVGRNEPCPCGSGKKFKRCCGANPPPTLH